VQSAHPCGISGEDMSTIAVIITDMFEDVEYIKPAEAFRKAGHILVHVGRKKEARFMEKKREHR
jgi:putative intracellular protease/amidase